VSLSVQNPNTSLFPEIDFASKVVYGETDDNFRASGPSSSISRLLWPLSNSGTFQIVERLSMIQLYVRIFKNGICRDDGAGPIILDTQDNGFLLKKRKKQKSGTKHESP
jgi:hypothetical protein